MFDLADPTMVCGDWPPLDLLVCPDDDPVSLLSAGEIDELFGPVDDPAGAPWSPAELLGWLESEPVGPVWAGELFRLSEADLDAAGVIRLAAQWQRLENSAVGRKLAAVDTF